MLKFNVCTMDEYFEKIIEYLVEKDIKLKQGVQCLPFESLSIEKYPEKLYKFRRCSNKGFESFSQDYLWFTNPYKFDDPEDASIVLGPDEDELIAAQYDKKLTSSVTRVLIDKFGPIFEKADLSKEMLAKKVEESAKLELSLDQVIAEAQERIDNLPAEQQGEAHIICDGIKAQMLELESETDSARANIINNYRTNQNVCCLTETFENKKMWEDYSARYSGFVIEYDIRKAACSEFGKDNLINLFPVVYSDKKGTVDFSPVLCDLLDCEANAISAETKEALKKSFVQSLLKDESYLSEREWRFILPNSVGDKVSFPFASAVYAGYKIKPHNYSRLKTMCKKKRIPLYKQKYSEQTATLSFEKDLM